MILETKYIGESSPLIRRKDYVEYWNEVCGITSDIDNRDILFTISQLVDYLDDHLPPECDSITASKIKYRNELAILSPINIGKGKLRKAWRYNAIDVRLAVLTELLRSRFNLGLLEIKEIVKELAESGFSTAPAPPTSVNSAFTLLRNRTLGAIITGLGRGKAEVIPRECFIAIRPLFPGTNRRSVCEILSWDDVRMLLETGSWHIGVAYPNFKLYMYPSLIKLFETRPEAFSTIPRYQWYGVTFKDDGEDVLYNVIVGLPEKDQQLQPIAAIKQTLASHIDKKLEFNLEDFPGLQTLSRAAFSNELKGIRGESTTISALCEIIISTSQALDYCAVLVPAYSESGIERGIRVQGHSVEFPIDEIDESVDISGPLANWRERYRFSAIVEPAVEDDPRLIYRDNPKAAAILPAIAEDKKVIGLLYVARESSIEPNEIVFSKELVDGLKAFGYVCGDIILRDRLEIETVKHIVKRAVQTHPENQKNFSNLKSMMREIAKVVEESISPKLAPHSWIYLLTLNVWNPPSVDPNLIILTDWLRERAVERTIDFLANRLLSRAYPDQISIGKFEITPGQYVFAIFEAVNTPEDRYIRGVKELQEELKVMAADWLNIEFYPWAVTFPYEQLRQGFLYGEKGTSDDLIDRLVQVTRDAVEAGPYMCRGHEALDKGSLDEALTNFESAKRLAPENWYVYKHLGEIRILQGNFKEGAKLIDEALYWNSKYSSARCLLADCLAYQGKHGEAIVEYEHTLRRVTNQNFLIRYGIALANMTTKQYKEALDRMKEIDPTIPKWRFNSEPHLEAIDKFEQAQKLSERSGEQTDDRQRLQAAFHYFRGFSYLQARDLSKAVEEFAMGRKVWQDDLQLGVLYAQSLAEMRES